jgi:hypothetical protein
MAYDFSFDTRQWWATVAACILAVLLAFAAGFLAGMMWSRRGAAQAPVGTRSAATHHLARHVV